MSFKNGLPEAGNRPEGPHVGFLQIDTHVPLRVKEQRHFGAQAVTRRHPRDVGLDGKLSRVERVGVAWERAKVRMP